MDAFGGLDDGVRDALEAEGYLLPVGRGPALRTVAGSGNVWRVSPSRVSGRPSWVAIVFDAVGDSWWGGSRGADVGDEAFPGVGLPHEADAWVFSCMSLAR